MSPLPRVRSTAFPPYASPPPRQQLSFCPQFSSLPPSSTSFSRGGGGGLADGDARAAIPNAPHTLRGGGCSLGGGRRRPRSLISYFSFPCRRGRRRKVMHIRTSSIGGGEKEDGRKKKSGGREEKCNFRPSPSSVAQKLLLRAEKTLSPPSSSTLHFPPSLLLPSTFLLPQLSPSLPGPKGGRTFFFFFFCSPRLRSDVSTTFALAPIPPPLCVADSVLLIL